MQLTPPPPDVVRAGLRAVKTVALADGTLHELERELMVSAQANLLGTSFDVDALEPIDGEELARLVPAGEFRERLLRAMVLVALMDGEASDAEAKTVSAFAKALGVSDAPLADLHRLVEGKLALVRLDIARRSFLARRIGQFVGERGLRGVAEVARTLAGFENPKIAERYRALEGYAPGTLGRAYHDFIRRNEFGLPGEKGAAPEPIVFHDCTHVLADYGTDPEGETQILAFQAGFQSLDPFFTVLFAVAEFHLGIAISPVAASSKMALKPALITKAFARGMKCTRDLSDAWDPWEDFGANLDELRKRYTIVPKD